MEVQHEWVSAVPLKTAPVSGTKTGTWSSGQLAQPVWQMISENEF